MTGALIQRNLDGVAARTRDDPDHFLRLASRPKPQCLWIGCPDCGAAPHDILGLEAGDLLVHYSLGTLAGSQDLGFLALMEVAIDVAGVRQVVVCGHYGCASLRGVMQGGGRGLVDHWLQPVSALSGRHAATLEAISDLDARTNALCELNIREQVACLARNSLVRDAWWRGQPLSLHGLVYSEKDGLLRDLEISRDGGPASHRGQHASRRRPTKAST